MPDFAAAILTGLGWGLLGVLLLFVFFLNLPYRISIAAFGNAERLEARAWGGLPLRLLGVRAIVSPAAQQVRFYFLGVQLFSRSFSELKRSAATSGRRVNSSAKEKSKRKRIGATRGLTLLQVPYKKLMLRKLMQWLFFRASLRGRIGLDDPFETGQLEAAVCLIQAVLPSFGRDVAFDYTTPVLEGRLRLSMTIWLPRIVLGCIGFLLRPEGRAVLRYYRQGRRSVVAAT